MSAVERNSPRRQARWAFLSIWVLLVAGAMWLSFANAVANVTRTKNPAMALKLDGGNSVALNAQSDLLLQASQTPKSLGLIRRLALRSVAGEAINPAALRLLGFVDALAGRDSSAKILMDLSSRLSRRELGTRLWLIETAVRNDDVSEALRHYDIALRSNIDSYDILLPTLTDALSDPKVRQGVAKLVKSSPPWMPSFLDVAIATSAHPEDIAKSLISGGGLPKTPSYEGFSDRLAEQLIVKHQYGALREYYRSLNGSDVGVLSDPSLIKANVDPILASVGWQLSNDTNVNSAFNANNGNYELSVFVGSGNHGLSARKLLFLAPGSYNFEGVMTAVEDQIGATANWQLRCLRADNTAALWSATGDVVRGRRAIRQAFNVSADCPYQSLELTVSGSSNQSGTDFVVERVSIFKG